MSRLPHRIRLALVSAIALPIIACEASTTPPASQEKSAPAGKTAKPELDRLPDIKPQ